MYFLPQFVAFYSGHIYVTNAMVELQGLLFLYYFCKTVKCTDSNEVSYHFSLIFTEVEPNGSPIKQKGKSFQKKIKKNLNRGNT